MYYTHGDMVIYRSDQRDRSTSKQQTRGRQPDPRPASRPEFRSEQRREGPSAAQQLRERVSELEERLAQLEAALESARQPARQSSPRPASHRWAPPPGDSPRRPVGEPDRIDPDEIRVSLYPQGGTHATVGPVRVVQQD